MNVNYSLVTAAIIALVNTKQVQSSYNTTCCLPIADDCSFYSRCLELEVPCGRKGYAVGYGLYYCNQFKTNSKRFSSQGQQWLRSTMLCLQTNLIDVANGKVTMDCPAIQKFAFSTHSHCYTQPGSSICTIPSTDWVQLFTIIYKDLANPSTLKEIFKVAHSCGHLYVNFIRDVIKAVLSK